MISLKKAVDLASFWMMQGAAVRTMPSPAYLKQRYDIEAGSVQADQLVEDATALYRLVTVFMKKFDSHRGPL